MGVELRHLAALTAIAERGSFSGAADHLGYVQSAVSQQIAYLERWVGVQLVCRTRAVAPLALTEAGVLLLRHASAIMSQLRQAQAELGTLGDRGELAVLAAGA